MMWVFWSLVCFVTFMVMWPAFEKQIPPDLMPWAAKTKRTTLSGEPLQPTQRKIGGWLFEESADGWVMVTTAREGIQTLTEQGEPPLLMVMCHQTWIEARGNLIQEKGTTLKVKGTANTQPWLFDITPTRLIAETPAEFTQALTKKADSLTVKLPYSEYGTQKFNFPLQDFPKAWAALKTTC